MATNIHTNCPLRSLTSINVTIATNPHDTATKAKLLQCIQLSSCLAPALSLFLHLPSQKLFQSGTRPLVLQKNVSYVRISCPRLFMCWSPLFIRGHAIWRLRITSLAPYSNSLWINRRAHFPKVPPIFQGISLPISNMMAHPSEPEYTPLNSMAPNSGNYMSGALVSCRRYNLAISAC